MAANVSSRPLTNKELEQFGAELDALRMRTLADLGEKDAVYIRRVVKAVNYSEAIARALLWLSAVPLMAWLFKTDAMSHSQFLGAFFPLWLAGTLMLGVSKILENMELGHNVMHGQYDWMRDPTLNGKTFEWDLVGTSDNWRKTHNFKHHTYTNVKGMDDDIGYGLLRLFPEQRWRPFFLFQPLIAIIFALLFQWGVAIQDWELGKYFSGKKSKAQMRKEWQPLRNKINRQIIKDYIIFPLLAGPFFLPVMVGNLIANGIRNVWTYMVIFCGHFTADVEIFPKEVLKNESRGHWYLRQVRGSSNLTGGKLFHIMTGNLSHQIEHHLYPDLPARRYGELAPEVKAICERYGQNYNTGNMIVHLGQVGWRILRHAFPSKPVHVPVLSVSAQEVEVV